MDKVVLRAGSIEKTGATENTLLAIDDEKCRFPRKFVVFVDVVDNRPAVMVIERSLLLDPIET